MMLLQVVKLNAWLLIGAEQGKWLVQSLAKQTWPGLALPANVFMTRCPLGHI
jgi:hypothetical protein